MKIVFLCGGSGTRLWPESRESLPKQFIPLLQGKSLLELTVERVLDIVKKIKPIFVCNKKHGFLVKEIIKKYDFDADIILEPHGKNTCAAIYLAAKHSQKSDNFLILPCDHLILNDKNFITDMLSIEKEFDPNHFVTFGVKPTNPSEAYGYIKIDGDTNFTPYKVLKFIEKPKKELAYKFISDGNFYWNAGIFIVNSEKVLSSIKCHATEIALYCDINYNNIIRNDDSDEINFDSKLFSKIPSKSIDYAVLEKEEEIYLYPLNYKWSDIGSWDSLSNVYGKKKSKDNVIQIDSFNNFIRNENRVIAAIGVQDLIIIDNDDATLICKRGNSEKVKKVIKSLLNQKSNITKEHSYEKRPWGKFENLYKDKICKIKKLTVEPQKRLSMQYHNLRTEHWFIVSGTASVYLDGKTFTLTKGQSINIAVKSHHFIENKTNKNLIIIETQLGTYFGEDDIVRLDDPYNRK